MAEPDRHIFTERDINAYQGYLPDEWGENTIGPIPEGTVLERLLLDLALAWRTASYTAQMPASSIRAMHAAAVGRASFVSPDSSIVAYSEKIIAELIRKVPELTDNPALRTRLMESLATIASEFRDRAAKITTDFPIEPIWADFMNNAAFRLSLWSSQRIAFIAFYNAYEVFLVDCLKVATGLTSLRTQMEEFRKGLRNSFRENIADSCWFNSGINIARLVRHALSHNGGRQTEDLKKQKHGIGPPDRPGGQPPDDAAAAKGGWEGDRSHAGRPEVHGPSRQASAVARRRRVSRDQPTFPNPERYRAGHDH
jgi:hypothetical protein